MMQLTTLSELLYRRSRDIRDLGVTLQGVDKVAVRKRKSNAKLLDECAVLMQKIVRMKAAIHAKSAYIHCVTCGKQDHWKLMQGGHWISRTWTVHKVCEENIHPQCVSCNKYRPERVADDYTMYMVDMYGIDWVEDMVRAKHEICKRPRADITDLKDELKARAKAMESEAPV
jgi:hypothetical protein